MVVRDNRDCSSAGLCPGHTGLRVTATVPRGHVAQWRSLGKGAALPRLAEQGLRGGINLQGRVSARIWFTSGFTALLLKKLNESNCQLRAGPGVQE